MAGWQGLPTSHKNPFTFLNYYETSHLSNSGFKIGNLTNFLMLFFFLATILY